jgi:hypothetical protein
MARGTRRGGVRGGGVHVRVRSLGLSNATEEQQASSACYKVCVQVQGVGHASRAGARGDGVGWGCKMNTFIGPLNLKRY